MRPRWLAVRLLQLAPVAGAIVLTVVTAGRASAASCFTDLRSCYQTAALRDDFIGMWLAGLDCELTFTDCTRRALIGR